MKSETGRGKKTEQCVGKVFGPRREMKVLAKVGRDKQRNELVWVFCRDCLTLKVVRWANLKRNKSCGCGRDENVRQHAETAIACVPWPLKLRIWAAVQGKAGTGTAWLRFADELSSYKLQKHERDQLVPKTHAALAQIEQRIRTDRWADRVAALRDVIENELDRERSTRGELTKQEYHRKKTGEIVGSYADEIRFAQGLLQWWGFLAQVNDPELDHALLRAGLHLRLYVDLANWLCRVVEYTQERRDARSVSYRKKHSSTRPSDRVAAELLESTDSPSPDQDLIDAAWADFLQMPPTDKRE